MAGTSLYPDVAEKLHSISFSHFRGYSSDITVTNGPKFLMRLFISRKGIFKKKWPQNKDNVLSQKATEPMELYKTRGQEPKADAVETCLNIDHVKTHSRNYKSRVAISQTFNGFYADCRKPQQGGTTQRGSATKV
jgi:hypothetical protein